MTELIQSFDSGILLFIQENLRCGFLNSLLTFITRLGDTGFIWILLGLVLLFPKKTRRGGFDMLICLLIVFIINDLVLKDWVARVRPYETINELTILVSPLSSFSFPSGHASSSFACALALTLAFGKKGAWSYVLATFIALSRLYVGVHYPTDVLAGMLVGTIVTAAVFPLLHKFIKSDLISKKSKE